MSGWIKLHRQIRKHWVWQGEPFDRRSAWIDLLMMANHAPDKIVQGNQIIDVDRGERITSEIKLAERWGWGRGKVRGFLRLLAKDGMIEDIKENRKRTRIRICNYCIYQGSENNKETSVEQVSNNEQTSSKQVANINKNDIRMIKNVKNDKEYIYPPSFEEFWQLYPRKIEKRKAYRMWEARLKEKCNPKDLILAAKHYAEYCKQQVSETKFIKYPATFLGPNKHFEDFMKPITAATGDNTREPKTFWDNNVTDRRLEEEKHKQQAEEVTADNEQEQEEETFRPDVSDLISKTLKNMGTPRKDR